MFIFEKRGKLRGFNNGCFGERKIRNSPADSANVLEASATSCTVPPLAHKNTKIQISLKYNSSTNMDSIEAAIADL